ncbi:hypothetical protein BC827DRAFT_1264300 [Russula dissimulans]|nr:hypothetical protein BC827DRAFT_1264300 [Russula dissimulans]
MAYISIESDEGSRLEESINKPLNQSPAGNIGYISDASKTSFWNVDYYQDHLDIDTKTPFWTLTTLILALFVTSSLAHSLVSFVSSDPVEYDFALLSTAVGLVYAYGIGVPLTFWAVLRYTSISEGWALVEAVAVSGYAMFVWIPLSILCIIPIPLLRWILCGVRFSLSGYFLVANIYPVLASADQKPVRLLIIVIAVLHTAVALLFKVLSFSYYIQDGTGPADPTV